MLTVTKNACCFSMPSKLFLMLVYLKICNQVIDKSTLSKKNLSFQIQVDSNDFDLIKYTVLITQHFFLLCSSMLMLSCTLTVIHCM